MKVCLGGPWLPGGILGDGSENNYRNIYFDFEKFYQLSTSKEHTDRYVTGGYMQFTGATLIPKRQSEKCMPIQKINDYDLMKKTIYKLGY